MVKQVGGERVDVRVLLPPGASPHTFEPTPRDMRELSGTKIFVKIGAGLEFWADKIVKAVASKELVVVEGASGVKLIKQIGGHNGHEKPGHAEDIRQAQSGDPHIWLDPVIAADIVLKIEKAIIRVDPRNAEFYQRNSKLYREKLLQLDREISARVNNFRIKEFVTFHSAWGYFARRYGLRVAGVIVETPGKEPGPKHIAKIIKEVKKTGSNVIFAEPQFSPKIAESIARESGAKVLFLDPIGGAGLKGRETYIALMRYNLSIMEEAMK
ncbi:MAG: zinc ABC transporter substrate-binding protein [Nitrospirae bacterium]|nr:zinc ABC transporter substrate-binding protein [Nitrospirota bacterium]